jgi:hypothetical protein
VARLLLTDQFLSSSARSTTMSPLLMIDLAQAIDADRRREARHRAVTHAAATAATAERSGR